MSDIIRLSQISFYGYHGVTAAEKETGRVFEIDCELSADLTRAGESDRLSDTISYDAVYQVIRKVVEGKAFSLLEGLGHVIAVKLLDGFPVERVTLKVRKLNPPVAGQVKYVEIEITRGRSNVL